MQICILPIKRTTRKIRSLASPELCATSKYEVVGYLISISMYIHSIILLYIFLDTVVAKPESNVKVYICT